MHFPNLRPTTAAHDVAVRGMRQLAVVLVTVCYLVVTAVALAAAGLRQVHHVAVRGKRQLAVVLVTVCYLVVTAVALGAVGLRQVQSVPLVRVAGIVVSPDGHSVYVRRGVGSLGALAVFARNGATGKLTQLQCVARRVRGCVSGGGLETPSALAIPRDGANLYVTALNGRSVGIYRRATSGRLAAAGSVTGLAHPLSVAVSPDGATVYVGGDRVWVFARARGGGLRLLQTLPEPARALAATDAAVYAGSGGGAHGTLVAYARGADGTLTESARTDSTAVPGIQQPAQIVAARGAVYVVSTVSGAVTRFDASLGQTAVARGLPLAYGLAVTDRVYVAYRDGVAAFAPADLERAAATRLTRATGVAGWGRHVYAASRDRVTAFAR
jgi:DNA-binding beta-propeller fold protein YncE